jgi:hypothetical protein
MASIGDLEGQSLSEIAEYHNDAVDSLVLFFRTLMTRNEPRYLGYSAPETENVLLNRIEETELRSCFIVLASLEAALRIDYLLRSSGKKKDPLSKDFRGLFNHRGKRASLDEDILDLWIRHHPSLKRLVGELRSALRFRHWLAHGRYWEPKLGRKFDYAGVYLLAELVLVNFPLYRN